MSGLSYIESPKDTKASSAAQSMLFAVFVLGGATLYFFIRFQWPEYRWLPLITICGLICVYALLARFSAFFEENDKAGDNCYYLGFLYTLISLGYSLYAFSEESSNETISNFGLALVSTFLGMFFRVLFLQSSVDLAEEEERAKLSVKEAADELAKELTDSVAKLRQFSDGTVRTLSEFSDQTVQNAKSVIQNLSAEFERELKSYNSDLMKSGARAIRTLDGSLERFDKIEEKLFSLIEQKGIALQDFPEIIEDTKNHISGLRGEVEQLGDSIGGLNQGWTITEESFVKLSSVFEQLKDVETKLTKTVSLLHYQSLAYQKEMAELSKKSVEVSERTISQFESVGEKFTLTVEKGEVAIGGIANVFSDAKSNLEVLNATSQNFASTVGGIANEIGGSAESVKELAGSYTSLAATYKHVSDSLKEADSLKGSLKSLGEFFGNLGVVTEKLPHSLEDSLDKVQELTDSLGSFGDSIQSCEGKVGNLVISISESGPRLIQALPTEDEMKKVTEVFAQLTTNLESMTKSITDHYGEIDRQRELLKSLNQDVRTLAGEAVETNRTLFSTVGELSSLMVKRLNDE